MITRILLFSLTLLLCNTGVKAQHQTLDWAFLLNNTTVSASLIEKSALDSNGNVFTIGRFKDTVTFGSGNNTVTLISSFPAKHEIFVAKYNPDGALAWVRKFEQQRNVDIAGLGFDIVTDRSGNVYASGFFTGTVKFSPSSNAYTFTTPAATLGTPMDAFVAKFDNEGNFHWANRVTKNTVPVLTYFTTATTHCYALSICNVTNNVLIAVNSLRSSTLGGDTLYFGDNFTVQGTGTHICNLDYQTGEFNWVKTISDLDKGIVSTGAIANDKDGNIYLSGALRDSADFDMGAGTHILSFNVPATEANRRNLFLAKYTITGDLIWTRQYEGNYYAGSNAMLLDNNANIYMTGTFVDTVDFDPSPNGSHLLIGNNILSRYNTFVTKLDSAGTFIWAGQFKSDRVNQGRDLALDAFGNVYTTGTFSGTADFDPGIYIENRSAPSISASHVFIHKLNADGTFGWVRTFGPSASLGSANGYTIVIDASNNIYAGGVLNRANDVDFNTGFTPPHLLSAIGPQHGYLMKLSCSDTSSSFHTATACNTYTFNNITYNESGSYRQKFWTTGGCDSIVTLSLTVHYIDKPFITVNNFELGVTGGIYQRYQWLKEGIVIPGATNDILHVSENGNYRVVVTTAAGCTDTSDVYQVTNATSIPEQEHIASRIRIFPNPSNDAVYIQSPVSINLELSGADGRILLQEQSSGSIRINQLSDGVYFLRITDHAGNVLKVEKIVKQ